MLKQLVRQGDEIVFDSITRMGRSMKETLKEYEWFTEQGVQLSFIKEPMINTSHEQDDVIKQAIQRVILTVLAAFAEKERVDIKERQAEGIEIARKETIIGVIGDKAQSIYEFQGADVKQFNKFKLPGMINYKMEDNHRSTKKIIDLLNGIRKDIVQKSPEKKPGNLPVLLIGKPLQAVKYAQTLVDGESITTLSYSNLMANSVRNNREYNANQKGLPIDEAFVDSDSNRRKIFVSIIKAIEYARLSHYKDAIKELSRHLSMTDDYNGQKTALIVIKIMLNDYHEYSNKALWTLYEKVIGCRQFQISKIRESKNGNPPSAIETYYKNTLYSNIALNVKIAEDAGLHRTIHKAKGSEFDNVLVIVKGKDGYNYNEERDLGFLLNPDIGGNEDHRVNYVACSRARENLFICVPEISDEAKNKLIGRFKMVSITNLNNF